MRRIHRAPSVRGITAPPAFMFSSARCRSTVIADFEKLHLPHRVQQTPLQLSDAGRSDTGTVVSRTLRDVVRLGTPSGPEVCRYTYRRTISGILSNPPSGSSLAAILNRLRSSREPRSRVCGTHPQLPSRERKRTYVCSGAH